MSGFDSGVIVAEDDLAFDFSAHKGPKGAIKEPSREQVDTYFKAVRDASKSAGLDIGHIDPSTPEGRTQLAGVFADASDEQLEKMRETRLAAIVALCSGKPSGEQIEALPYRVQQAFFGWLTGKFANPTNLNGASAD